LRLDARNGGGDLGRALRLDRSRPLGCTPSVCRNRRALRGRHARSNCRLFLGTLCLLRRETSVGGLSYQAYALDGCCAGGRMLHGS